MKKDVLCTSTIYNILSILKPVECHFLTVSFCFVNFYDVTCNGVGGNIYDYIDFLIHMSLSLIYCMSYVL